MRFIVLFLMVLGVCRGEVVNEPVVNLYVMPEEDTEIESQAIYGSAVEVLEQESEWSKIRMQDGTEGWVLSAQIAQQEPYEKGEELYAVKNFFAHVYRVPDTTLFPPLMTLTYGAPIRVVDDAGERWIRVDLVSGEKAWIQRGDLEWMPRQKTLEEVLTLSKKFLGLTYTWGGTSTYGFDCSGFVQMLFREMGVELPRNARDQAKSELLCEVEREDLEPGDLIFFGEERITHVGLYLGDGAYIHATVKGPCVMVSRLQDDLYSFRTARRVKRL